MSFFKHWIHVKKFQILRRLVTKSFFDPNFQEGQQKLCRKCIHAKLVSVGFDMKQGENGQATINSTYDFLCRGFGHNRLIPGKKFGHTDGKQRFDGQTFPGSSQTAETIWMYPFAKDMNPNNTCPLGVHLSPFFLLPRMRKMKKTKRHLTL